MDTSQSVVYVEKLIMGRLPPQGAVRCASSHRDHGFGTIFACEKLINLILRQKKIRFKLFPRRLEKTKDLRALSENGRSD